MFGNYFAVWRVSIADYSFLYSFQFLDPSEEIVAWMWWVLAMVVSSIIFLNFIVGEASNSYSKVRMNLLKVI